MPPQLMEHIVQATATRQRIARSLVENWKGITESTWYRVTGTSEERN